MMGSENSMNHLYDILAHSSWFNRPDDNPKMYGTYSTIGRYIIDNNTGYTSIKESGGIFGSISDLIVFYVNDQCHFCDCLVYATQDISLEWLPILEKQHLLTLGIIRQFQVVQNIRCPHNHKDRGDNFCEKVTPEEINPNLIFPEKENGLFLCDFTIDGIGFVHDYRFRLCFITALASYPEKILNYSKWKTECQKQEKLLTGIAERLKTAAISLRIRKQTS